MVNSSPARHIVVIPAAGAGSRMGAKTPKQYQPIAGRSMLEQTIGIFARHPRIDEVWVLLAPTDPMQLPACKLLRCGGETRALTVLQGLRQIPAQPHDWVLVHDAARPCLSRSALDRLLETLRHEQVGGLLAVPVADTLKKANADQGVAATVDRTGLWQAQTPQMFRYGLLMQALQAMTDATDEAQAVECLGYMPRLVPGERSNIKVTYPEDLLLAALILQGKNI